jgi:ABC-type polysaccharide/polyol phosphate export permease
MTDLLREVRVLFDYRDLIHHLVARDLKVRYRRSAFGLLWSMLQPLLSMLVLQLVFSSVFRSDIYNFPVYAMSGILFWNFFSQSIVTSMNSLKGNAHLLQKLPVPKGVFPLAAVLSGGINLLLAMVPLFAILIFTGHPLRLALLFLPFAILISLIFTLGAGLLLSPLAVFFSDVVELVGVVLTLVMYMTPIFYPMAIVPERFRFIIRFNPVRSILEVFRDPIYHGKVPPLEHVSVAVALALVTLAIGFVSFRRNADRIPFYV